MAELSLLINPRKCLGTVAYIAAGNNPEPFTWSMIQLAQFCNEYVCTEPGEWIDWDHGVKRILRAIRRLELLRSGVEMTST